MRYINAVIYKILAIIVLLLSTLVFLVYTTLGSYTLIKTALFVLPGQLHVEHITGNVINGLSIDELTYMEGKVTVHLIHGHVRWVMTWRPWDLTMVLSQGKLKYDDLLFEVQGHGQLVPPYALSAELRSGPNSLTLTGVLLKEWQLTALIPQPQSLHPALVGLTTTIQANGAPKLRKVAVLMTDGGYNTYRGYKDNDQQTVSNWAVQLCTNMKAQGIEIYTVGFALNQLSSAEQAIARTTLQACGTDIKHFYETLTVPELKQAFRDIAVSLSTLSLVR